MLPVSCAVPKTSRAAWPIATPPAPDPDGRAMSRPTLGAPPTKPPASIVPELVVKTPETASPALPLTKPEISPPDAAAGNLDGATSGYASRVRVNGDPAAYGAAGACAGERAVAPIGEIGR